MLQMSDATGSTREPLLEITIEARRGRNLDLVGLHLLPEPCQLIEVRGRAVRRFDGQR